MLIVISGVDCAGKSTHIELLRQYFTSIGKTSTLFWYRPGYSKELETAKKIIRPVADVLRNPLHLLAKNPLVQKKKPKNATHAERQTVVPAPIWITTAIMDTAFQYSIKLRYLMRKYDVVICNRYVDDACLDLVLKYPQYSFSEDLLRKISALFPVPDKSILLWLPYETMLERAEKKKEPFPDSPETRKMRWRAYDFMREDDRIQSVDVSGTIEESHEKIRKIIEMPS